MKTITEIIKQLEQIRDVHGDLQVVEAEFVDGDAKVREISAVAIHHPTEPMFIVVFDNGDF